MQGSDCLYFKKVEITGINTADIPALSDKERELLISEMKKGNSKAKDRLVMSNIKLVLSVIQKVNSRNVDADDLFQVGCIGLIKALNNFDTSFNVQFSTYGVVMITGEIKRYIRDNSILHVSRSTKDLAYRALSFKERYVNETDSEPSVAEMAQALDASPFRISNALEALAPTLSLYEPVFNDDSDGMFLMEQLTGESFENEFCTKTIIKDVIQNLRPREKQILYLRYIQDKTQSQAADAVGISQAQVSRIEKSVLNNIKQQLYS